jgi:hypothetical protein
MLPPPRIFLALLIGSLAGCTEGSSRSDAGPVMVSGPGTIGADGRATGPMAAGNLRVRQAPGFPECLVLERRPASRPFPLIGPDQLVGIGGTCPGRFWSATTRNIDEFSRGIIIVEGIGPCRIPNDVVSIGTIPCQRP